MRSLPCTSSIFAALACGCFSPVGMADTSSGTMAATDPSTGVPTSSTSSTPTTGAPETTGTTGGDTSSSTGDTTTGALGTTGTTGAPSETSATDTTGSTGASETTMGGGGMCGDGVIDADEGCDDGNQVAGDGCNAVCVRDALFVFVSSMTYVPTAFSTPEAGNKICTDLAKNGTSVPLVAKNSQFITWLSYDRAGGDAIDRLPTSPLPYFVTAPTPVQVFKNTDDIPGENELDAAIRYDENGEDIVDGEAPCNTSAVWTGTDGNGMGVTDLNCGNWMSVNMGLQATTGRAETVNDAWTAKTTCFCAGDLRVYCFEAG